MKVKGEQRVIVDDEVIMSKIYTIRGKKVILDRELALLYNVSTGNLNKSVKRNAKRFPDDFMFQLNKAELDDLIFQTGISRIGWGGVRKLPYAFTEQGVAMLSGLLSSEVAIEVNIKIIRIFTKLREMLLAHKDILLKLEELEKKTADNSKDVQLIFEAIRQLVHRPSLPRERIGFRRSNEMD